MFSTFQWAKFSSRQLTSLTTHLNGREHLDDDFFVLLGKIAQAATVRVRQVAVKQVRICPAPKCVKIAQSNEGQAI